MRGGLATVFIAALGLSIATPAAALTVEEAVGLAIVELGKPPCGTPTYGVENDLHDRAGMPVDGLATVEDCSFLFDERVATAGGLGLCQIAVHELAHLHFGYGHPSDPSHPLYLGPGRKSPAICERERVLWTATVEALSARLDAAGARLTTVSNRYYRARGPKRERRLLEAVRRASAAQAYWRWRWRREIRLVRMLGGGSWLPMG